MFVFHNVLAAESFTKKLLRTTIKSGISLNIERILDSVDPKDIPINTILFSWFAEKARPGWEIT